MTYWNDAGTIEVARILEVSAHGVVVLDQRGGHIDVLFKYGNPPQAPRVGEYWYISFLAAGRWRLESKLNLHGNHMMFFGMTIDAADCIGREDIVSTEIMRAGIDEVWLVVASNGRYYWQSSIAQQYGLSFGGDVARTMVSKLKPYGIKVVLCFDWAMWSDATNAVHNLYQQERYVSGVMPDTTREYVAWASPFKAKAALSAMFKELSDIFYNRVNNYALLRVHLDGADTDYSPALCAAYKQTKLVWPPVAVDTTDNDAWWDWQAYREGQLEACCSAIRASIKIGNLSVSVPTMWRTDEFGFNGRVDNGIGDSFASDSHVGAVCVRANCPTDDTDMIGLFDFQVAVARRMANGASSVVMVTPNDYQSMEEMLEVVGTKNKIGRVVFDSYFEFELLRPSGKSAIASAIMKHRMMENDDTVKTIGFVCSSDSRDVAWRSQAAHVSYSENLATIAGQAAESSGHKLQIIFDGDLDSSYIETNISKFKGMTCVVAIEVRNLTDSRVSGLSSLVSRQDKNVVSVGMVGYNVGRTLSTRVPPLWALFGGQYVSVGASSVELSVGSTSPVCPNSIWDTRSWSSQRVEKVESVLGNGLMLYCQGRNVLSGIDLNNGVTSMDLLNELIIYAASR